MIRPPGHVTCFC